MFVFGVLKSGSWGWVVPKSGAPQWFGMSPVPWLMVAGLVLVWSFLHWEARMVARGKEPLVDPALLRNEQLRGGLTMFFFQYLLMMGVFFLIPLYLSVALGLSAIATGVRIMPMSLTLLAAALGVPRLFPDVSPRLVVRVGIFLMLLGMLVLLAAIDVNAGAEIVTVPLLLVGLGIGALASQLGAVTVSAVPDEQSSEVGGLQNTVTNLGRLAGHGTHRVDPDRRADGVVSDTHRDEQRGPSERQRQGATPSWPPASRSCPTSSSKPPPRKRARAPR